MTLVGDGGLLGIALIWGIVLAVVCIPVALIEGPRKAATGWACLMGLCSS